MQKPKYDPRAVEKKWQRIWKENKTFKSEIDSSKPKYYILDMFPYPSGAGLHVGHVTGYTGTDILARYKRQKGFNVLHPMGWDSFGLPAEQYAIRTGTHPAKTTQINIDTYRRQLESLGFSYDWDREFATSDPKYYKWTQWIFTKLFEKGLAYEAEVNVNFCPALGTVLSNEEVENGRAKEGGYLIERRPLKQWILRITAYADRLLADLDLLDWPDHLKKLQTNWIGRSEGAVISFVEESTHESIIVFTTRPDTLFGATYLVLAPEHPLVERTTQKKQSDAVKKYRAQTAAKNDLERTDLAKEKTGVWTGSYALHPITGEKLPIWIADYVLIGYGTGAVMAVPSHDERDFEFATIFDLPIRCVYDPDLSQASDGDSLNREDYLQGLRCWTKNGRAIHSSHGDLSLNGLSIDAAKEAMIRYLEHHSKGKRTVNYKLRDWLFSRQRYWGEPIPIVHFADGTVKAQLGMPDMRVPILYALTYPNRFVSDFPRLDFRNHQSLTFDEPDLKKFRNLSLAYNALKMGGNMPCIMNAANEIAVNAFLDEKIGFMQMSDIVEHTMESSSFSLAPDLELLETSDSDARATALNYINKLQK